MERPGSTLKIDRAHWTRPSSFLLTNTRLRYSKKGNRTKVGRGTFLNAISTYPLNSSQSPNFGSWELKSNSSEISLQWWQVDCKGNNGNYDD